jgi:hypothetical protein
MRCGLDLALHVSDYDTLREAEVAGEALLPICEYCEEEKGDLGYLACAGAAVGEVRLCQACYETHLEDGCIECAARDQEAEHFSASTPEKEVCLDYERSYGPTQAMY